jgi:ribosomal protein L25 (general stress protein Ctc)
MAERKRSSFAPPRARAGKNDSRRARRNGQVPVTIYGGAGEAVAALAPLSELAAISDRTPAATRSSRLISKASKRWRYVFADRQI